MTPDCGVRNEQSEVVSPESGVAEEAGATGEASASELARAQTGEESPDVEATHVAPEGLAHVQAAEGPENMDDVDFVDDDEELDEFTLMLLNEKPDRP